MKKVLILPLICLGGAVCWWISRESEQGSSSFADTAANSSHHTSFTHQERTVPVREIKLAQTAAPKSALSYEPITVAPCSLVPLHEQNISSQVDGIVASVLVDLGSQVGKGELLA